jgi:hypothetical protein
MQRACAILLSEACADLRYFSTLPHKLQDFRGKKSLLIQNVFFLYSLQRLSEVQALFRLVRKHTKITSYCEIFLILRRIQEGIIINVHRPSCKVTYIHVRL